MIHVTPSYLLSQGLSENFPERFWTHVDKNGPIPERCPERGRCWVWRGAPTICSLYDPELKRGKYIWASRASYILNVAPIPEGLEICHHCDFGCKNEYYCVNPAHLFPDTHDGNMKDMKAKGRGKGMTGEAHHTAKLTDERVSEIRRLYRPGNGEQLAKQFGISRGVINKIVKGKLWKHLHDQPFLTGSLITLKLTQEKANAIREAYARGGISHRALAKQYGVGHGTIYSVVKGRIWVNVKR